jgi:hypothetical protein
MSTGSHTYSGREAYLDNDYAEPVDVDEGHHLGNFQYGMDSGDENENYVNIKVAGRTCWIVFGCKLAQDNKTQIVEMKQPGASSSTKSYYIDISPDEDVRMMKDTIAVFANNLSKTTGQASFNDFAYPQDFKIGVVSDEIINVSVRGKSPTGNRNIVVNLDPDFRFPEKGTRFDPIVKLCAIITRTGHEKRPGGCKPLVPSINGSRVEQGQDIDYVYRQFLSDQIGELEHKNNGGTACANLKLLDFGGVSKSEKVSNI